MRVCKTWAGRATFWGPSRLLGSALLKALMTDAPQKATLSEAAHELDERGQISEGFGVVAVAWLSLLIIMPAVGLLTRVMDPDIGSLISRFLVVFLPSLSIVGFLWHLTRGLLVSVRKGIYRANLLDDFVIFGCAAALASRAIGVL